MDLDQLLKQDEMLNHYFKCQSKKDFVQLLQVHLEYLPDLSKVCSLKRNQFLKSLFSSYIMLQGENLSNLKFPINFAGKHLHSITINEYTSSDSLLIIKKCEHLINLSVTFKTIQISDFENAFSQLKKLEKLMVHWICKSQNLPENFINSLSSVTSTLKTLHLMSNENIKYMIDLPLTLILVFNKFEKLQNLKLHYFKVDNELYKSIININLIELYLNIDTDIIPNFTHFSKMTHLTTVSLSHPVNDKIIETITKSSSHLEKIIIAHTLITDDGIKALQQLSNLKHVELKSEINNSFITNQSIEYLQTNKNIEYLSIELCSKITNKSIVELINHLNGLKTLKVGYTGINDKLKDLIVNVSKRKKLLEMFVGFKIEQKEYDDLVTNKNIALKEIIY